METESNHFIQTWSLAAEEQFNVLLPVKVTSLVVKNRRHWTWLLITLSISSLIFLYFFAQKTTTGFFSVYQAALGNVALVSLFIFYPCISGNLTAGAS